MNGNKFQIFLDKVDVRANFLVLAWEAAKNVLTSSVPVLSKIQLVPFLVIFAPFVDWGRVYLYIRRNKRKEVPNTGWVFWSKVFAFSLRALLTTASVVIGIVAVFFSAIAALSLSAALLGAIAISITSAFYLFKFIKAIKDTNGKIAKNGIKLFATLLVGIGFAVSTFFPPLMLLGIALAVTGMLIAFKAKYIEEKFFSNNKVVIEDKPVAPVPTNDVAEEENMTSEDDSEIDQKNDFNAALIANQEPINSRNNDNNINSDDDTSPRSPHP